MFPSSDPPLARRDDPETSHLAAERLKESGRWQTQKQRLLTWMRENHIDSPERSLTANELAVVSGIPHPCCHKRLPDLRKDALVWTVVQRECRVTGEQAWTWRVTSDEERAELLMRLVAAAPVREEEERGGGEE